LPRWHIGQKKSNKLIESGSWALSSTHSKAHGFLARA